MKKVIIIIAAVVLVVVAALVVVPLLGGSGTTAHNEYVKSSQAPTCDQDGYEHRVCDCGCGLDYMVTIPARGEHQFNRQPSCTEDATCSVCGYTEEAIGHIGGFADCENGPMCGVCGEVYGSALGHKFGAYVSDGNEGYGDLGTETAKCERCFEEDTRDVTTHECFWQYKATVSPSDCTNDAVETYECYFCLATENRTIANSAWGHDIVTVPAREADCGLVGWNAHEKCTQCDYTTRVEVPALTHNFQSGVCTVCHRPTPSEGLVYELSADGKTAVLIDIQGFVGDHIVVSHAYQGAPVTAIILNEGTHPTATSITIPSTILSVSANGGMFIKNLYVDNLDDWFAWGSAINAESLYVNGVLQQHITVPAHITTIPEGQFSNLTTLLSIDLNQVEVLSDYAFAYCEGLTSIDFGDKLHTIGNNVFEGCGLTEVVIPNTVTTLRGAFFGATKLESVTLPDSIVTIPVGCFSGCTNLREVTMSDNVTRIETQAFMNCGKLTTINWPSRLEFIGSSAFSNCQFLLNITIHAHTTVDMNAFYGCKGLTSVTLPASWTTIPDGLFAKCSSLSTIINWSDLTQLVTIGAEAFAGTAIQTITLPNTLSTIGASAFEGCMYLNNVVIPNSVRKIDNAAFKSCIGLFTIDLGNGVERLGDSCFELCYNLSAVSIPGTVNTIGKNCFKDCTNLASVTMFPTWKTKYNGIYTEINAALATDNATLLKETYVNCTWEKR